jgi:peptidoglycan/LPS O-acetylase OafA/YrhL
MELVDTPVARPTGVLGDSLSGRVNSLNFLRLFFATLVLLSHAAGLATLNSWVGILNQSSIAQLALYGFFAISGYLIAGSAIRNSTLRYLTRRCLRIFPGLIACLLITAFFFGLLVWRHLPNQEAPYSAYFTSHDNPFTYVIKNSLLANPYWTQHTISGTPIWENWNASIWTLFFEFICYIVLLGLAFVGFLKHRFLLVGITVCLWMGVVVITLTPSLSSHFSFSENLMPEQLLRFLLLFLAASVFYIFREEIPDSGWLAIASAVIFIVGLMLPLGGRTPTIQFTPSDIFIPFLIYPVLWCGIHLPFNKIGSKNDYSYGVYIYGWPISVLVVTWHLERFGIFSYWLLCLLLTAPFAVASWWLIEKPSLGFSSRKVRQRSQGLGPNSTLG